MDRESLDRLSEPVVKVYSELENDMLLNLASMLKGKKKIYEDDPEAWRIQMLSNLGMIDRYNLNLIRKNAGLTAAELNRILYDAGLEGIAEDEKSLKEAVKKGAKLIVPPPIHESPQILAILSAYQSQAANVLNLVNTKMLDLSKQIFINELNRLSIDMATGNLTHDQALRRVIRNWNNKGVPIPPLNDKSGRTWQVETYVRMVLASTNNNLVNEMQDERLNQWDIELVKISSHSGNRPGCVPYAGKIFSLKEGHPTYKYLYDSSVGRIGDADSLFGVNCKHYKVPYIPGILEPKFHVDNAKDNKRIYEESQIQRSIENEIRKAKRLEAMLKVAGDEEGAKMQNKLVRNKQAKMRAFLNETGRTRRRDREQIHI